VTARLHQHDCAYALRVDDGRIVFVVPLEHDFTLIGPVDTVYGGDPGGIEASEDDIDYLCAAASRYLREPITRETVLFAFSGVRALPQASGRRMVESMLHLDGSDRSSPLLSVIGGRIAAYRRQAERVLARLSPILRMGDPWTARTPLPGGGFAVGRAGDLVRALRAAYPFLSELHAERLVSAYGTRAASIVTGARRPEDLGRNFGYDLTEAEVGYLMAEEWAVTAGDVIWRRSRLGLRFNDAQREALGEWMTQTRARTLAPTA
jgi:glycerol-3-phosphate dehydrogenase